MNQRPSSAQAASRTALSCAVLLVSAALLAAPGCGKGDGPAADDKDAASALAQQHQLGGVRLSLHVSRGTAKVADPIAIDVRIEHPATTQVVWPETKDAWGVLRATAERVEPQPPRDAATAVTTRRFTVLGLDPGKFEIPAQTFRVEPKVGEPGEPVDLVSDPVPIEISSVLTGTEEPTDIRTLAALPVELPEERRIPWVLIGVCTAGAITILSLAAWALRRLRNRPERIVVVPAHVWALGELDRLAREGLVEQGRVQEYYFRLSGVVRGYIERRFAVLAPDMTTEEFIDAIRDDRRLEERHRRALGPFLESCDLVKFARYAPQRAECDAALVAARQFVLETAETASPPAHGAVPDERGAAA